MMNSFIINHGLIDIFGMFLFFSIFVIFNVFFQKKKPDYNYGTPYTWISEYHKVPIILEIRLDEVCDPVPVGLSGCSRYKKAQLYLHHITGEVFKCWFSSKSDDFLEIGSVGERYYRGNSLTRTLWDSFENKGRKIEISEVTFSVARGEKAFSKKGLRYCDIERIKFKHFSDVEHIALYVATNGRGYYLTEQNKKFYVERLERYKKIWWGPEKCAVLSLFRVIDCPKSNIK